MKLLLVGELNETLYSLHECLSKDFQVQMCSENTKNVKDMIRLLRPAILVMNIVEMKEEIPKIFGMLSDKLNSMPMVVIGTAQMSAELKQQLVNFKNAIVLERPLNATEVLKNCKSLLKTDENVEEIPEEKETSTLKNMKKILVVDDNALILRRMKQLLEEDYQVVLANSGEKALEILEKGTVDLILLDYAMPGMDGREVFERVIADDKTKNIPVIFLTSVAEKEQIFEVLVHKPFGYILKPPANDRIKNIIKEAFKEV